VKRNTAYVKSSAALEIARELDGFWKLLYIFIVVPPFIRNALYDVIARNRYKRFGKKRHPMAPRQETRDRFIE
jgi:predicted DCC family thiol-disulfide oxidoreductase YuxK